MKQTFNHIGDYRCVCGKHFTKSQAYVGHKARCKVYQQQKRGEDYDSWAVDYKNKLDLAAQELGKKRTEEAEIKKKENEIKKKEDEAKWVAEGHYCEKCGKLMDHKYATGRFCSVSCANSKEFTDEIKEKISEGVKKFFIEHPDKVPNGGWTDESLAKAIETRRKNRFKKENYLSDVIPSVEDEVKNRKPGYQSREIKYSYPEQFWRTVFDNNKIEYIHEFKVNNGLGGLRSAAYKMDFLIDNKYDVEIDGSQHLNEDIKLKDIRRDEYLSSLGYIVYRIPWINPTSIENKDKVYEQIVDLFKFLNKELITVQS